MIVTILTVSGFLFAAVLLVAGVNLALIVTDWDVDR
jgi:hypothetical protein